MKATEQEIKAVLTSLLYELARDHLPIGRINKLVKEARLPVGKYSDEILAEWSEMKAVELIEYAEEQTEEPKKAEPERTSMGPGEDATYDSSKTRLCEDCSVQMAFFKSNNPDKMDFYRCPSCLNRVMCP